MAERISVVIPCHHERQWSTLLAAIRAVRAQQPAPVEVVLVVDHHPALYARARRELAGVTVLANQRPPGASGTRNTGAWHARTPVVAFLDADAVPEPGWLAGLTGPLTDPAVVGTGGAIRPLWQRARPGWFPEEFLWTVGGAYPGLPATTAPVRNVWSASMAVRRDEFVAVGGFRDGFGKLGERSRPEDTDLCLRLGRTGQWRYVPGAVVSHLVLSDRSTFRAYLRRCYHEGRGKVALARLLDGHRTLGTERQFLRGSVPAAIRREVAATIGGGGREPAARAAAVIAGVAAAAAGGAVESVTGVRAAR